MDLAGLADAHGVGALSGILGTLLIKEIVGRLLRRVEIRSVEVVPQRGNERIETEWDNRHEALIKQLLDHVAGVRSAIEVMGERMANHQASTGETKMRVDEHGERISALEVIQAELRARIEYIGAAND